LDLKEWTKEQLLGCNYIIGLAKQSYAICGIIAIIPHELFRDGLVKWVQTQGKVVALLA